MKQQMVSSALSMMRLERRCRTMLTLLKQTEDNLAIIFNDSSMLSIEQTKALQIVTAMVQERFQEGITEWVRQRSDVQTPLSF